MLSKHLNAASMTQLTKCDTIIAKLKHYAEEMK